MLHRHIVRLGSKHISLGVCFNFLAGSISDSVLIQSKGARVATCSRFGMISLRSSYLLRDDKLTSGHQPATLSTQSKCFFWLRSFGIKLQTMSGVSREWSLPQASKEKSPTLKSAIEACDPWHNTWDFRISRCQKCHQFVQAFDKEVEIAERQVRGLNFWSKFQWF